MPFLLLALLPLIKLLFLFATSPYKPATLDMAPSEMKAIKIVEKGKAEIQNVPLPKLRYDYILVKVNAVALNPTDW